MNTNNELIEVIDSACAGGCGVKSIRKQKHAPSQFYMTRADGKQIGPVSCQGSVEDLERKFNEAQSHLSAMKTATRRAA